MDQDVIIKTPPSRLGVRKVEESRFLEAISQSDGSKSNIAQILGIHRNTVKNYIAENPVYAEAYQDVVESRGDMVEGALIKKIEDGDTTCILFYCKTRLKNRGYIEKQIVDIDGRFSMDANTRSHRILEFKGLPETKQVLVASAALNAHLMLSPTNPTD